MRNWNIPRLLFCVIHRRLPDYLWGIETQFCLYHCTDEIRFQTTYEELKLSSDSTSIRNVSLPDYLWGIETRDCSFNVHTKPASRLPMRNWNTLSVCADGAASISGFQTTYEELKRTTVGGEKMKGSKASRLPMRNWNSTWLIETPKPCLASRLPMRNWNEVQDSRFSHSWPLPDYLWGIETSLYPLASSWLASLPDYLWGIETPFDIVHLVQEKLLPDYLWGIETFNRASNATIKQSFQTTYEELKLSKLYSSDTKGMASRLPMRNWNISLMVRLAERWGLPDYLWGIETICN